VAVWEQIRNKKLIIRNKEVMVTKKFDLEDRLVKFACMCLDVCDLVPGTKTGQNLEYQLSKSSTS
jgi:hypothetical protein